MNRKTEWTYESFPESACAIYWLTHNEVHARVRKNVFQRYMDTISDVNFCKRKLRTAQNRPIT